MLALSSGALSCSRYDPLDPAARYRKAHGSLAAAKDDRARFYALGGAAKAAVDTGRPAEGEALARELLVLAKRFPSNWNHGNAIHDSHVVLGRVALRRGDLVAARQHLLDAGDTHGSPQLGSFGPNMALANELLTAGETECVLAYFAKCRRFWSMGEERLSAWEQNVRAGQRPSFSTNLIY